MIDISIAPEITDAGVDLVLGCTTCNVTVSENDEALVAALDRECATRAADSAATPPGQVPAVAATRQAYKALGKDPSRYRPSAEALMRRIAQGKELYRVNTVVDTNNLVSLRSGHSIGAYRLDALAPPLLCRRGAAGESYEAIGRGPLNLEGLPLLADTGGPFGSPTSDSARSMITPETQAILMVIFGFGDEPAIDEALGFAVGALSTYCAAQDIDTAIITA